jgi:hypothetical protein
MAKIFRRREYITTEALLNAIACWIENNRVITSTDDFFVIIRKPDEWEMKS